MKLTERQKKLNDFVNNFDDIYGVGNGYVYENTDVDIFIKEFLEELKEIGLDDLLLHLNENSNKSFMEELNEI